MGFVGRNKVFSVTYNKTKKHRYSLIINTNNTNTNPVIVIMKNPSSTCKNMLNSGSPLTSYTMMAKCHIDRTTGRVLRFLSITYKYDLIITLNLYSFYDSKSSEVQRYYYGSSKRSFTKIDNNIRAILTAYPAAPIICAWGNNHDITKLNYDSRITQVYNLLNTRNLLQYDILAKSIIPYTHKGGVYPVHGYNWY